MEDLSFSQASRYRQMMMQHGRGLDKEGYYIYDQTGEGVGSFFASLLRGALPIVAPLAAEAIKGLSSKAVSHINRASKKRSKKNRTSPYRPRI